MEMENRADVYGVGVLEKGKQLARQSAGLLRRLGIGLLGMLLSNAALPGGMAPFGIAFAAAAAAGPEQLRGAAVLGAAMGYLLHFAAGTGMLLTGAVQWRYLIGLILALGVQWAGKIAEGPRIRRNTAGRRTIFCFAAAALGVMAPILTVKLFTRLTVQELIGLCSEGIAAVGACWIFSRMLRCFGPDERREDMMARCEIGPILVTGGLAVAALSRICIYELSVGRTLALLAVLICGSCVGRGQRFGAGAASGVAAGALVALCGTQRGFGYTLPGIWGLGGLLAGLFAPLGKGFCCAALLLGETAAVFLFAQDQRAYIILAEALAASGMFWLLPARVLNLIRVWMGGEAADMGGAVGDLLLSQLRGAGEAMADIARTTEAVADKLMEKQGQSFDMPDRIYRDTVQQVCQKCPNGIKCWAGHYGEAAAGLGRLDALLQQGNGIITPEAVQGCFPEGCIRPEEFAVKAQRDFQAHLEQKEKKRLSTRVRGVVTDQFEGMALVMEGMVRQLRGLHRSGQDVEKRILSYCQKNRLEVKKLSCYENEEGRLSIELELPVSQWERLESSRRLSTAALTAELGTLCERQFSAPKADIGEAQAHLRFCEQPRYRLKTGSAQISAAGSRISGDTFSAFVDERQKAVLLISDGMGTGPRAAMDSAMASGLLSRLISAGIGPAASLKLVNAALLVKSEEESLATIDLASVDLYTGQVQFFKAGAAPTFLRRGGRAGSVEAASLPAGILQDVAFERACVTLREGDMVVMVSDGVVQADGDWLSRELNEYGGQDPDWLANHLAKCAQARTEKGREDDITVLVGMLEAC